MSGHYEAPIREPLIIGHKTYHDIRKTFEHLYDENIKLLEKNERLRDFNTRSLASACILYAEIVSLRRSFFSKSLMFSS